MRQYELMYILDPTLDEDASQALVGKIEGFMKDQGIEIESNEPWGKRRMAYRIKGHWEGNYMLSNLKCNPDAISEMERRLRVSDGILRFLTVRVDELRAKAERRKAKRETREASRQKRRADRASTAAPTAPAVAAAPAEATAAASVAAPVPAAAPPAAAPPAATPPAAEPSTPPPSETAAPMAESTPPAREPSSEPAQEEK